MGRRPRARKRAQQRKAVGYGIGGVVLALIAGLTMVAMSRGQVDQPPERIPAMDTGPRIPGVAFLGDSYTEGSDMNHGSPTYPTLLGKRLNFRSVLEAIGGSGFVNGNAFLRRVPTVVADGPAVVVVEGGHNDGRAPRDQVRGAADAVLRDLAAGLPQAKLVVIGPIWPNADVPPAIRGVNDDLRGLAATYGAVFVDPIGSGWFTGPSAALIGSDGTHPTGDGHTYLADQIQPVLAPLLATAR
jgi:lysophospholipase L1-like esterase